MLLVFTLVSSCCIMGELTRGWELPGGEMVGGDTGHKFKKCKQPCSSHACNFGSNYMRMNRDYCLHIA